MSVIAENDLAGRVAATNARVLVVQIRKLAEDADGPRKTELRNLMARADQLERDLEAALRQ